MANITAIRTTGKVTLTGATIDKVTLTAVGDIEVDNWGPSGDITVTVNSADAGDPVDPVAGAKETWTIPSGTFLTINLPPAAGGTIVKVLGNSNVYTIQGAVS